MVLVEQPLLGVTGSWEVFAPGTGSLARLEMARGRVTTVPVPVLNSGGEVSFVLSPTGALIRPLDNVPAYFVPDGGEAELTTGALGHSGPVFPGPTTT